MTGNSTSGVSRLALAWLWLLVLGTFPALAQVPPGNALSFLQNSAVATGTELPDYNNNFTVEAWVKTGSSPRYVTSFVSTGDNFYLGIYGFNDPTYGGKALFHVHSTFIFSNTSINDGKWHHLAGVNNNGAAAIYVDGVLEATGSGGGQNYSGDPSLHLRLGSFDTTPYEYGVDEVRIWNTARSAAQLKASFNNVITPLPQAGLDVYYTFERGTAGGSNAGVTTLPNLGNLAGYTGTLSNFPLTGATGNWIESYALVQPTNLAATSAASGTSITATWTAPPVGTITNYVLDCATTADFSTGVTTVTPAGGATSATVTGRAVNTRYWLRLRATKTSVANQGAYSPDMVNLRTASGLTAPGNALAFDGIDDYATGTNASLPQGNAARTLEAWMLTSTTGGVIFNYGTATNNQRSGLLVSGNGRLYYVGEFNDLEGNKVITDGHWHHVAATYDGTTLKLYVDGVLDISSTPSAFGTSGTTWRLGSRILTGTSLGEQFNGRLDEARVYNTALTQAQVQAEMTSTSAALPANLVAYYDCDQGTAGGANAAQNTLVDRSLNYQDGTLTNFALTNTNTTSNFVESYALVLPRLNAPTATSSSFSASWLAPLVGTLNNYVFDYSLSATFASGVTSLAPTTATSQTVSGLLPNRNYYYRVRADKTSLSGTGAYATGVVLTLPAQARPGNALAFDGGPGGYARTTPDIAPDFENKPFTLEAWVRTTASSVGTYYTACGSPQYSLALVQGKATFFAGGYGATGGSLLNDGRWHYLAGKREIVPSGQLLSVYVDGVLQGTSLLPYFAASSIGFFSVGTLGNASSTWIGQVDEVRIWNVARSAAQIQAAYTGWPTLPQAGLEASYNCDQGVAGGNNTAVTTLTDQSGNLHDGTMVGMTLTGTARNWVESYALSVPVFTAATAVSASGFTANWTAPIAGAPDNGYLLEVGTSPSFAPATLLGGAPQAVPTGTSRAVATSDPTLTYYYRVRADKSSVTGQGALSPVAVQRPVVPASTPPGNALAFDGVDDLVAVDTPPSLQNLGRASFTAEAWVYCTTQGVVNSIIRKDGDYNLYVNAGGVLGFDVWANGSGSSALTTTLATSAFPVGHWAHIAATWNGTAPRLYVNGVDVTGTPATSANYSGTQLLQLGSSSVYGQPLNGRLDEVRLYSAALTAAQVRADMTSTSAALPASLLLYYNFDLGTAGGSNAAYTTLPNLAAIEGYGTLSGFALSSGNTTSNWVESYALLQPTNLAVSARTGTGFTATWTAPLLNGAAPAAGVVPGYVLDASTSATFTTGVSSFAVAGAGSTSVAATGLADGTDYYVGVRAEKASVTGQGAYSAIVLTHTVGTAAQLANLVATTGVLSPAFVPTTLAYTLYVPVANSTYTLTPTASNSYTTITVNSTAVPSGTPSVALSVGSTATVVLTSEDGLTTTTYTVQAVPAPGYFRSVATGNWGDASTWETSGNGSTGWFAAPLAPTGNYLGTVAVRSGHTVTVAAATSTKTTTVESGGILNTLTGAGLAIPSGATMVVNAGGVLSIGRLTGADGVTGTSANLGTFSVAGTNALTVNGTLVLNLGPAVTSPVSQGISTLTTTIGNGGRVVYYATALGVAMPIPTWGAGSTLELAGGITNQTYAAVSQALQNLDVNLTTLPVGTPTLTSPLLFSTTTVVTVAGTLTVRSTGLGTLRLFNSPTSGSLTLGSVDGSGSRSGGYVQLAGTNVVGSFGGASSTTGTPITVQGNFLLNGGTFAAAQGNNTTTTAVRATPLTVNGNFAVASGATFNLLSDAVNTGIAYAGGTVALNGNFSNAGTVSTGNTASTVQKLAFGRAGTAGAQTFGNTGTIAGLVNATVGGTTVLDMGSSAFTGTGTFATTSGSTLRLGSPDGISASGTATGNVQSTGTRSFAAGTSFEFNGSGPQATGTGFPGTALNSAATLGFNNAAGVTLSQALTVPGTLSLTQGPVISTATNLLTLGTTVTAVGTLDATATNTGRVAGPFRRWVAAATANLAYPVGTAATGRPATINYTTAPTTGGTLMAEFVAAAAGSQGLPLTEGGNLATKGSDDGYWRFTAADGLTDGTYSATFTFTDIAGVSDYSKLLLLKRADASASWALLGTAVANTGSNTAPVLSRTGLSGFSDFTAGLNATPLPVELTAFTATAQGRSAVRLAWATASEKNSAYFEVERSLDGTRFARTGTVAAAGTSSSARAYELLDAPLPADATRLYYRLRQVDLDGTFRYSPVRTVALPGAAAEALALYPNPTRGGTATLAGTAPGTAVTVFDALGRQVLAATADAAGTAALALPAGLPTGVYVVRAGSRAVRLTVE